METIKIHCPVCGSERDRDALKKHIIQTSHVEMRMAMAKLLERGSITTSSYALLEKMPHAKFINKNTNLIKEFELPV